MVWNSISKSIETNSSFISVGKIPFNALKGFYGMRSPKLGENLKLLVAKIAFTVGSIAIAAGVVGAIFLGGLPFVLGTATMLISVYLITGHSKDVQVIRTLMQIVGLVLITIGLIAAAGVSLTSLAIGSPLIGLSRVIYIQHTGWSETN